MLIGEALDRYTLQLRADGRSQHTVSQYQRHIGLLNTWLAAEGLSADVGAIDHEMLALFLVSPAALTRPDGLPKRQTSINTLRSSLKTCFTYLHGAGWIERDPARLIRRARCSPGPPRALTASEQQRLVARLDTATTAAELRDRALFRLLLGSGARLSEALAARVEDLDLEEGELRLRQQKGGGEGMVYLPGAVVGILLEYLGDRTSGWLFPGQGTRPLGCRQAHRRFSMWLERAGITRNASPHSLRHSYATDLYRRTGDLPLVQQALRHRAISSSVVYARCDTQRVRDALGVSAASL